ncbi:hypothetical protein HALLA_13590 [Halostagnicola larsenii XH-48]|uniref:Uncharacterized protein n=1 Tax=Halostagnicola larsenii XH-48 TaxID=797299 RepID=W0JR02_9EURY|nr:hypothetical protein [Halostagnicola larsenii]AHG01034.1 hypothetical protein HALLA_13590 [Halostagnicola larsenii XH-48]
MRIRRAQTAISTVDTGGAPDPVGGREETVAGELRVEKSVNENRRGETVIESAPIGLLLWRIRSRSDPSDGWTTVETGLEAGEFSIDTGNETIRVDADWLVDQHGDTSLWSLSAADLKGYGVRESLLAKTGSLSEAVYLQNDRDTVSLTNTDILSAEVGDEIERTGQQYQLETWSLPDGASCTVHGELIVDRGDIRIRGSDDVPMTIGDDGPESLERTLRGELFTSGVYAAGSLLASLGFLYVSVAVL